MTRREPLTRRRAWRARQIALWVLLPALAAGGLTITYPAAIAGTAGQPGPASDGEELIKQLVVMLRGTLAEQSFNGAGVIIGRTPDRVYIATAHHVVRQATQQAERIEAHFRWLPGEWKTVNVLADGDVDLDLAVLAADARGFSLPDLPWGSLGDPKGLAPGSRVFPVGFPNAMPWFRPQLPHIVNSVTAQQIRTEGQVFPGNSGGALVTEDWRLVGLVSNVSAVLAGSTRMDLILEKLKEWRYPVSLSVPTKSSTPPKPEAGPKPADPTLGTCAVSGVVVDGSSRRPLSGVNVGLAARMPGGGERIEALARTTAITGQDGTFSFTCPTTIARERFPLELIVWHADWRTQRPNIEIQSGDRLTSVVVPVTLPRATGTDPAPMDDCVAIVPGLLSVEHHEGRGGWHVVAQGAGAGQVLLPDFEANESGARTVALLLRKYTVTEYCQIGRPPAVFYFLSRGIPVLMSARGRGGPGSDVAEQCRAFNPAALAVAEPDTMSRDWSIRDAGQMVLTVADQGVARRTLATIRRHGFTSVCYSGRPMRYLR